MLRYAVRVHKIRRQRRTIFCGGHVFFCPGHKNRKTKCEPSPMDAQPIKRLAYFCHSSPFCTGHENYQHRC
jgi:hypothetical protein